MNCSEFLDHIYATLQGSRKVETKERAVMALLRSPCFARASFGYLSTYELPTPLLALLVREAVRRGLDLPDLDCFGVRALALRAEPCKEHKPLPEGALPTRDDEILAFLQNEAQHLVKGGLPETLHDWMASLLKHHPSLLLSLAPDLLRRALEREDVRALHLLIHALRAGYRIPDEEAPLWVDLAQSRVFKEVGSFSTLRVLEALIRDQPWTTPILAERFREFSLKDVPAEYAVEAIRKNAVLAARSTDEVDADLILAVYREKRESDPKWVQDFLSSLAPEVETFVRRHQYRDTDASSQRFMGFLSRLLQESPPESLNPALLFPLAYLPLPPGMAARVWSILAREEPQTVHHTMSSPDNPEFALRLVAGWAGHPETREDFFNRPGWVAVLEASLRAVKHPSAFTGTDWFTALLRGAPQEVLIRWSRNRHRNLRLAAVLSGRLPHHLVLRMKKDRAEWVQEKAIQFFNRIRLQRIHKVLLGRGVSRANPVFDIPANKRYHLRWLIRGKVGYLASSHGPWYLFGPERTWVLRALSWALKERLSLLPSPYLQRVFREHVPPEAAERFLEALASRSRVDEKAILDTLMEWAGKEESLSEAARRELDKAVLARHLAVL